MAKGTIRKSVAVRPVVAALCLWLLTACAEMQDWRSEPFVVERDFRTSVSQMITQQIADPTVAFEPDPEPVMGLTGEKSEQVFEAYRKDVAKPAEVRRDINFNIFSGGR